MYFEVHGRREPTAPTVLLSSGLGGSATYWAPQLEALGARFRVVVYDQSGTGRTGGDLPADYSIAAMARDVLDLLDQLSIARCHVVGHALGGLVGLQIALDRPDRLDRLVVVNGWSRADPHTGRCFAVRKDLLRDSGVAAYLRAQPIFLYPATWLSAHADAIAAEEAAAVAHFPGADIVLRRIAALLAFDVDARLAEIRAPTLVVAARDDILVPHSCSTRLAAGLPSGRLVLLDEGGHACNVTMPEAFNDLVVSFLVAT